MALELTDNAKNAALKISIEPSLVLEIDGVETLFTAIPILEYIRIGDPELYIGNDWVIGGLRPIENQADLISLDGTGSRITQQLLQDKGSVSSAASLSIQLIDKDNAVSELISPSLIIPDTLGVNARVYFGFKSTAWPEDYVKIHQGYIDDVVSGAGFVKLNIVHPEKKKIQDVFIRRDSELTASVSPGDTSISVLNADLIFPQPVAGPDATIDPALKYYVQINDEIMRYETVAGSTIGSLTRGQLTTLAASHAIGDKVTTFFVLEDDLTTLALKVMLSGTNDYYREGVQVESFQQITPTLTVPNAIFFEGINLQEKYGLVSGDYITTTGATNGSNNVTLKQISSVTNVPTGSYIVVSGVSFVTETDSPAEISFRSKYDTLGIGLRMTPEEVDVEEHERWRTLQLSDFNYRIYLRDTVKGKDLLDEQIYSPFGAYSIPRKGKASMGYHIGPVPVLDIKILDEDNIKNPSKIQIRRTTQRYFYNAIAYKFDEDSLEADKFLTGVISLDTDSQDRIPVGNAVFNVESKGIRSDLDGVNKATLASIRRLNRYKFAAEHFEKLEVFFGDGFNIEPGDLVLIDFENLGVTNIQNGTREKASKFYEVMNRSVDLKTGSVDLSVVDTNFNADERYGLISPSSEIVSGTTTYAYIKDSFGAIFPGDEPRKWADYHGLPILIHSEDFTFQEEIVFTGFDPGDPYKMLFQGALSAPVQAGWVIDIPPYSTSTDQAVNRIYKLIHAHLSPIVPVTGGVDNFSFNVSAGDALKFFISSVVRVHNETFTVDSPEVKVNDISGTLISVDADLGFTPSASESVEFIGFADKDQAYRYI